MVEGLVIMRQFIYYNIEHLTLELLRRVRICLTDADIDEMKKRRDDIINSLRLSSYDAKLLAEDMFEKGFIAGMIEIKDYDKEKTNDT
jgi:hypothetical protein